MEKLRILLVEDEPDIRDLLLDALTDAGFAVISVHGSEEATATLGKETFQAVVTDIDLRSSSTGWDVARRARESAPEIAIVYMTGAAAADWASQGVPNSVLVPKPFAPAQIVSAVSTLLNVSG